MRNILGDGKKYMEERALEDHKNFHPILVSINIHNLNKVVPDLINLKLKLIIRIQEYHEI